MRTSLTRLLLLLFLCVGPSQPRYLLGICDIENKHYWSRSCYHVWEMYSKGETLCEIFRSKIRCRRTRNDTESVSLQHGSTTNNEALRSSNPSPPSINAIDSSSPYSSEVYHVYPNEVCEAAIGGLLKCKYNDFQYNKCVLFEKRKHQYFKGIVNWRCMRRQLQEVPK